MAEVLAASEETVQSVHSAAAWGSVQSLHSAAVCALTAAGLAAASFSFDAAAALASACCVFTTTVGVVVALVDLAADDTAWDAEGL